uniref:Uncharacterized protein n=1 Tax=Anguilla anguilla TaxID=7936 RepID=A0A0E9UGP1_ANGAN
MMQLRWIFKIHFFISCEEVEPF